MTSRRDRLIVELLRVCALALMVAALAIEHAPSEQNEPPSTSPADLEGASSRPIPSSGSQEPPAFTPTLDPHE